MKYIRTKDFIVELETWMKIDNNILIIGGATHKIDKQADTIEELCDEFVVIGYKIKYPFVFSKEGISIDDFWKNSPSDTIVYGAIWTEWGLKYVAKMKNNGELELL